MKEIFLGAIVIILVGVGGLVYKNMMERPIQSGICPIDAKLCPDGTKVGRTSTACIFPVCPPPNISLPEAEIEFAIPEGFVSAELSDANGVAAYELPSSSGEPASIVIRQFPIRASSTALATIQETAIGGASGLPAPATAFTSTIIGSHRFTVVSLERFEGVINTAYYLARNTDVLRFDAIDRGVTAWMDPNLKVKELPAHQALQKLLSTLQGS